MTEVYIIQEDVGRKTEVTSLGKKERDPGVGQRKPGVGGQWYDWVSS